ncbi:MAG: 2,4-dihydroxyhept-2-ene-1,7-dioic acid aldolase [Planctomycetes bacterium]|nr:2,4-dihydroxyhept-2-ene-1,7-dioic acid aldolase [Planctomycetota bacterium]
MGRTRDKLRRGEPALGGWLMIGHPTVAEVLAGEGFDWLCVDMEHTATDVREFYEVVRAVQGTGVDLLARLHSCDPVLAKLVLDGGAQGIIVPSVNTPEEAARSVAMAKFPPDGFRGVSLCRATDHGRNFSSYFAAHNREVLVVVMLEHVDAVRQADAILGTPGIDAALVGPYDLSASMELAGQLDHPRVQAAQQTVLDACARHGVASGIHVVSVAGEEVSRRIAAGFRFIACGVDTLFLRDGCRRMLDGLTRSQS